MTYYKLYSATPLNIKVVLDGEDSNILIPAGSFVVVGEAIGKYVNIHYPSVEVAGTTLEEYQAYRKEKDKTDKQKELDIKARIEAEALESKLEIKRVKIKLAAQEITKAQIAESQAAHLAKVAQDEKDTIVSLGSQLTQAAPAVEPKKSGRKSK